MTKMISTSMGTVFVIANVIAWGSGKTKTTSSESFWECLKSHSG